MLPKAYTLQNFPRSAINDIFHEIFCDRGIQGGVVSAKVRRIFESKVPEPK